MRGGRGGVQKSISRTDPEPESVKDTVEEAGVAKVCKAGNARTICPSITPSPTILILKAVVET